MDNGYTPYLEREIAGVWFGDGREVALLEHIYGLPSLPELRNNPKRVIAEIDRFAQTVRGLVNFGEIKGPIVTDLIASHAPTTMIELGGYVGYSAILFGDALRRAGGQRMYSIEKNPLFAAVAASLIDLAGLSDVVKVVVGTGAEGIQRLVDDGNIQATDTAIGMIFLDHHKPSYTHDIKLCERLGLVGKGTVLVADNMTIPGNPPYAEWVRATVAEKRAKDVTAKSPEDRGDPNLRYESRLVNSFDPSGEEDSVEITICVAVEAYGE